MAPAFCVKKGVMVTKRITALRKQGGRKKRVNVYLDDNFAFSLEPEVVIKGHLAVGRELDGDTITELSGADIFQRCMNAAAYYLGYRPRSESELRERLSRRGFDAEIIGTVLLRLKELGLVDDMEFARFWRENRQSFSPRSGSMTRLELKRKGVAEEIISQVLDTVSDEDAAYQAGLIRARRLTTSDYQTFRRRLGEYLKRRGFGYGVIKKAVEQLWQELGSGSE